MYTCSGLRLEAQLFQCFSSILFAMTDNHNLSVTITQKTSMNNQFDAKIGNQFMYIVI